ncbi:MAG: MurR/RpiR family transcriptional regulator [Candidatus Merdivicinus sp.]|jgi:DNA-binding MurR/RpiR family transcriptional regulator
MCIQFPEIAEKLTAAEQSILEFIEGHREEFLFMTIGQVAEQLHVSDATVSRFAKHVGCRDFKHLKAMVLEQNHLEGPAGKLAKTLFREDSFQAAYYVMQQQLCLEKTAEHLDAEIFERAIYCLLNAKRIFLFGKSASASVSQLLYFRLRRLGLSVSLLPTGGSEIAEGLAQVQREDVVVIFSFSKISKEARLILDYQKEAGFQTVAFTSRLHVPTEEQASVNLYVYRGKEQEYHSMTAAVAVVDALVVALSEKCGADSVRCLHKIHQLKKYYADNLS